MEPDAAAPLRGDVLLVDRDVPARLNVLVGRVSVLVAAAFLRAVAAAAAAAARFLRVVVLPADRDVPAELNALPGRVSVLGVSSSASNCWICACVPGLA